MGKGQKTTYQQPNMIALLVAEFLGTALLLFLGCMGCITGYEETYISHYMPSITFGLTIMIIIQIFGHISGAHLNPAVTLVSYIFGHLDLKTAGIYVVGQFVGAIFGYAGLKLLVPSEYIASPILISENVTASGFCVTNTHAKTSTMQGLAIETVITAVLILVCLGLWDRRNAQKQDSVPLRFGFIIAALAMAAGPFTGASMNTARSFAPALLNGVWTNHWIYWVGPTLGAVIAAYLYKFLYAIPDEAENEDEYDDISLQKVDSN
ncbi:PREDICTED: aquaporin AQPAn.G-like isoform X2 [Nicrophorus vespilloides]|uniref:Aquaporin AQPAn.G-like isoform X2 n=1 Tax=Nicrophorus vespilloides TaxID=110193 RepID=A0ABM1MT00_NICVS|nr:PREDICTED: aquaporin AQPAn.G-like isoform X2 [Nicrophorus vespilloides]